jgi:hypothetical protein
MGDPSFAQLHRYPTHSPSRTTILDDVHKWEVPFTHHRFCVTVNEEVVPNPNTVATLLPELLHRPKRVIASVHEDAYITALSA